MADWSRILERHRRTGAVIGRAVQWRRLNQQYTRWTRWAGAQSLVGPLQISCTVADRSVPRRTCWVLSVKEDWKHLSATPSMPKLVLSLCSRMSWSTVSNAAERSKRTSAAKSPRSTAKRMSEITDRTAVSIEKHGRKPDWTVGSRLAVAR